MTSTISPISSSTGRVNPSDSGSRFFKTEQIHETTFLFYFYLKITALLFSVILGLIGVIFVICCIFQMKRNLIKAYKLNRYNKEKNIFKRIWDLRSKKKIDDRVNNTSNILQRNISEISHVSNNNSNISLYNIQTNNTLC